MSFFVLLGQTSSNGISQRSGMSFEKMKIWCICNSPAYLNHSSLSSNVTDVNRRP